MIDGEIIKAMLLAGRVSDLLDLMEGESEFTGEGVENMPKTEEEKVARGQALDHVRFIKKYGFDKEKVIEGTMVYSSRPEGFDEWLILGAPGIEPSELNAYLEVYPL